MKVMLFLLHVSALFFLAYKIWKKERQLQRLYWSALTLKVIAGLMLGWVYTYYYTIGDTFKYFRRGSILAELARKDPGAYFHFLWSSELSAQLVPLFNFQPRALFFTKIVSVFNLITLDSYWLIAIYFSVIGFLASWYLVKQLAEACPSCTFPAVIAFCFYPSIVFWTSGLIKESLAMAALYFLAALFLRFWFRFTISFVQLVLAILALWILWNIKYYFAAVFLPVVFAGVLYKYVADRVKLSGRWVSIALWFGLLIGPLFLVSFLHPNFYPEKLLKVIVHNYNTFHQVSDAGDVIHFYELKPDGQSMLVHAPKAFFSGLFRPFLWEAHNVFQLFSAIENTVTFVLAVLALGSLKLVVRSEHRILIISLLVYVVLQCVFITLSAPNFGTLSRFRVGYFSFFIFIILCNNPVTGFLQRFFQRLVP